MIQSDGLDAAAALAFSHIPIKGLRTADGGWLSLIYRTKTAEGAMVSLTDQIKRRKPGWKNNLSQG